MEFTTRLERDCYDCSCHGVPEPRYTAFLETSFCKPPRGTRRRKYYETQGMEGMSSGGGTSDWYRMLNRTPPQNRRPEHTHTPLPSSSCRDNGILRGYGPNAPRSIKSDPTHHHQWGGGGISADAQAGDPNSPNRPIHWLTSSFYFIFYVSYVGIDRLRVKMMSNGTPPPAPHDAIAIDAQPRWLLPLERAPPPPHNEGCTILHGFGNPAPLPSNGSPPPCPPMIMMSPLPSSPTSTFAATSLCRRCLLLNDTLL